MERCWIRCAGSTEPVVAAIFIRRDAKALPEAAGYLVHGFSISLLCQVEDLLVGLALYLLVAGGQIGSQGCKGSGALAALVRSVQVSLSKLGASWCFGCSP